MMTDRERILSLEKQVQQQVRELAQLREQVPQFRGQVQALKRRLYGTWASACIGVLFAFVSGLSPEARAQAGRPFEDLRNQINVLVTRVDALETRAGTDHSRLTALETKTQYVSVSGTDMIIEGANLHIRNGSGGTFETLNGLGNLIIGYNEVFAADGTERGGSHNLVIGPDHDYSSAGGLVAGRANRILAPHASVSGGSGNTASGYASSISGGQFNTASGLYSSASGGFSSAASGNFSSVSGGYDRTAASVYDWVAGALFQDQ